MTGGRITPTQWGKEGGRARPVQLGSTEAVLAAVPDGGAFIVASTVDFRRVRELLARAGRDPLKALNLIPAHLAAADDVILRIPAATVVGIDCGAFDREPARVWEAAYKHLSRFPVVHWG